MNIVIDWRNLAKIQSYSIMSGSIPMQMPTEMEEIAFRISKRMYMIKLDHKEDNILIAVDSKPYWRTKYLNDWYTSRGLEPIKYKGNRDDSNWPFKTSVEEMEDLYAQLLIDLSGAIGAKVVEDEGLEADDIWGLVASTSESAVGYTNDSDWAQLCNGNISCVNLSTGEITNEPYDIRIKWIGGDSGDNVKGCAKNKKDGTPAKNGWAHKGAKELLNDPDWTKVVDADELERNRIVTTLPCPLWDMDQASDDLISCIKTYPRNDGVWDKYMVTAPIRKQLNSKEERDIYIQRLRMHLQSRKNEDEV